MTTYFYNDQNSSVTDNVILKALAMSDAIIFGSSAVWSSVGENGIALRLDGSNKVTVNGQLYGDTAIGANGSNSTITVGTSGNVSGVAYGINLSGYGGNQLSNYGMISGNTAADVGVTSRTVNAGDIAGIYTGLYVTLGNNYGLENSGTISGYVAVWLKGDQPFVLNNSGSILSDARAVNIEGQNDFASTITNSGTISGLIYSFGPAPLSVLNSGVIQGSVYFGTGADTFDSSTGHFFGAVSGSGGDDTLIGSSEANRLSGDSGADDLSGGGGNDTLNGGAGGDFLDGGDGIDLVSYDGITLVGPTGVTVDLATPGRNTGDAIGDRYVSIEGIVGSSYDDTLSGDGGANRLVGGRGDDVLDGRAGNDLMRGGFGNDSYFVDSTQDRAVEYADQGTDTVTSVAKDYTLTDNVEKLVLGGTAAIAGHGNALDNVIFGNAAANILDGGDGMDLLDGGKGADTMTGGNGWDTYYVDNAGDEVIESPGDSNSDTVLATISYTLPDNVEILFLEGNRAINATGNSANNLIGGNNGANTINGLFGNDQLSGGAGVDRFVFSTTLDATANVDTIGGFVGGTDKLQLSKATFTSITGTDTLSAAQFHVGTAAHDASDRIIYDDASGNLYYDPDGSGSQTQVEFAILTHAILQPVPTLAASDIQLIG